MKTTPRKKVLFTSHVANFQKFNRPFMRMLKEQGWEVHYASDGEEKILDCDKEFTIPFERSPFKPGNIKAYFQLKKIINREKYDMIHTHTPMGSVVTRLAAMEARKKGTRVIYTAHGFHFFKGAPLANWLIYYPIEKLMARYTDTLITINNEDFERAKKKFKTDVRYVPGMGVDLRWFEPQLTVKKRSEMRTSLGLKSDDYVVIYIAEIIPRKNHKMALRAIRKVIETKKNTHLLLVGKDSMSGRVQEYAQSLDLLKNVHFLGYRRDVKEICEISNLSITTSRQEGLAVGVMEALASGLPVIGTNIRGHIKEIELVNNNDDTQLAKKILDVQKGLIELINVLPKDYHMKNVLASHRGIYGK